MLRKEAETLIRKDNSFIWHPFTQSKTKKPTILFTQGKGCYLITNDKKKYLDAVSSWWVNLHGHAHPYIAKKISEQAKTLEHMMFTDFTHKPAVELSEKLLEILPQNMSRIFFSDNGSTAVEAGLKMAIQFWYNNRIKKKRIIALKGGYHGDTFGAMSLAKNNFQRPFFPYLFEIVQIDPPFKGKETKSEMQLEKALEENDCAAFIYEPMIQGVAGMKITSTHGMENLLAMAKDKGALLIADEVMTGFGRTGPLFASDYYKIKPDIIALSKGITGGFLPLGATSCTEKIFKGFYSKSPGKAFLHGHSYTANPLACVAAIANLDLLVSPQCHQKRKMIENCHQKFLQNLSKPFLRAEAMGTILVLEYPVKNLTYFSPIRPKIHDHFLSAKILVRPLGNVLYIIPPYCITEKELNFIYETIEESYGIVA